MNVQKHAKRATVNVDGKHLKQSKKRYWHVADGEGGKNDQEGWVEEVGEKKMAAVFDTVIIV